MTTSSDAHPPRLICDICKGDVAWDDAFVQIRYREICAHKRGERSESAHWKIAHMNCPNPNPSDLHYLRVPDLFREPPHNAIDHIRQKVWIGSTESFEDVTMRLALCKPKA